MRKLIFTLLVLLASFGSSIAQTVGTFDNLTLSPDSYWDGSDQTGGFASGNGYFSNFYDTSWGGYWASGWAYSNQTDTTLTSASPTHLYCSRDGGGFNSSAIFAVGTQNSVIVPTGPAAGKAIGGFYVTNCTYAFNSMSLGDAFAKKFGGASGNDPDWFKLVVRKYLGGALGTDSVEFYLADFRFSNNAQDYILKDWGFVNLISLGNCDSLVIELSSSDVGGFGMNTPAYYCIDNFITMDSPAQVYENKYHPVMVCPTLCSDYLFLQGKDYATYRFEIMDMSGKILSTETYTELNHRIDVSALPKGMYVLQLWVNEQKGDYKFIKQ